MSIQKPRFTSGRQYLPRRPELMTNSSRILVIIPVHNERSSIARVISEVRATAPDCDILVVDDASDDGSQRIARQLGAMVVVLPFNLGIGGAVQTGFKVAKQLGYEIVVQVDGDGQHDPSYIKQLVEPLMTGVSDISIGSRHLYVGNSESSLTRRAGMRFFSWLTSRLTSSTVTDCSSGFRALNKRAYVLFSDDYPVDFPDAEALITAHRAGLRICEIPTRFRERDQGKSSLRAWRLFYYPIKETFSILVMLSRRQSNAS